MLLVCACNANGSNKMANNNLRIFIGLCKNKKSRSNWRDFILSCFNYAVGLLFVVGSLKRD